MITFPFFINHSAAASIPRLTKCQSTDRNLCSDNCFISPDQLSYPHNVRLNTMAGRQLWETPAPTNRSISREKSKSQQDQSHSVLICIHYYANKTIRASYILSKSPLDSNTFRILVHRRARILLSAKQTARRGGV